MPGFTSEVGHRVIFGLNRQVRAWDSDVTDPHGLGFRAQLLGHRTDRLPLRPVLVTVLQHHPHGPFTQLVGIPAMVRHRSIISTDGASTNPGAVHKGILLRCASAVILSDRPADPALRAGKPVALSQVYGVVVEVALDPAR